MKTKNGLLSDCEKEMKMRRQVEEKKKLNQKLQYWKARFERECINVDEEDHNDFKHLFNEIDHNEVSDDMKLLLQQQEMALSIRNSKQYRWHPKIIKFCLDIYSTSPKAFDTMKTHLILPSKRLIRYYKNSISHNSGWNREVIAWCRKEADRLNLNEKDRWSGLIFDEMTIQEDLEFVKVGGQKKLVGAVSLGMSYDDSRILTQGTDDIELASKVMQFGLVTDTGFRFALAHFPVKSMPAVVLLEKFWEGVELCSRAGFWIYWLLCDGGEPNRTFIKLLFPYGSDPAAHKFVAYNMHTGDELVVMVDCKHNFKKIRNHIEKSTLTSKGPRKLVVNNCFILFKFWREAFAWDQSLHSLNVHEKLREAHFDLTPQSRMRNSLAEEVLNDKMLNLMKNYQAHLENTDKVAEATALNESIQLLQYTSQIIELFTRKDVIHSIYDVI